MPLPDRYMFEEAYAKQPPCFTFAGLRSTSSGPLTTPSSTDTLPR